VAPITKDLCYNCWL